MDKKKLEALCDHIYQGDLEAVKQQLQRAGAKLDLDIKCSISDRQEEYTPLSWAIIRVQASSDDKLSLHQEIALLVMNYYPRVFFSDKEVLHLGASCKDAFIVENLLAHANVVFSTWGMKDWVNSTDESGEVPLMIAAQCGNTQAMEVLLSAGAHIEQRCISDVPSHELTPLLAVVEKLTSSYRAYEGLERENLLSAYVCLLQRGANIYCTVPFASRENLENIENVLLVDYIRQQKTEQALPRLLFDSRYSFSSEEERNKHPQARLIPKEVWDFSGLCSQKFSYAQLVLMETPTQDIVNYLNHLPVEFFESFESVEVDDATQEKCSAWLALAYAHPAIDDGVLIDFANRLNLTSQSLFQLAVIIGRATLLNKVVEDNPGCLSKSLLDALGENFFQLVDLAIDHKHIEVLKILIEKIYALNPDRLMLLIKSKNYRVFRQAACDDYVEVIKLLIDKVTACSLDEVLAMISYDDYAVFKQAARDRQVEVMKLLLHELGKISADEVLAMNSNNNYAIFNAAVPFMTDESFEVMNLLLHELGKISPNEVIAMIEAAHALTIAMMSNNLQMVHMLYEVFMRFVPWAVKDIISRDNYEAFGSESLPILMFLIDKLIEFHPEGVQAMIAAGNYRVFKIADLPLRERLIELAGDDAKKMIASVRATRHVTVDKVYPEDVEDSNRLDTLDEEACSVISSNIKFSSEEERMQHPQASLIPAGAWYDFHRFQGKLSYAELTLMQTSADDIVNYLSQLPAEFIKSVDAYEATREKSSIWLALAYAHPAIDDGVLIDFSTRLGVSPQRLFQLAVIIGRVTLLNRVIDDNPSQAKEMISASRSIYEALLLAAKFGHLSVAKFLMDTMPQDASQSLLDDLEDIFFNVFDIAYNHKRVEVLRFLIIEIHSLNPGMLIDIIKLEDYRVFRESVCDDQVEVMKLLIDHVAAYAMDDVQAMISHDDYAVFQQAACHGHVAAMKLLIDELRKISKNDVVAMIEAGNYAAFNDITENAPPHVVQHVVQLLCETLTQLAPLTVKNMISRENYEAFQGQASPMVMLLIDTLLEFHPDGVQAMIITDDYSVFRTAVFRADFPLMERLIELAGDDAENMVASVGAIRQAVLDKQDLVVDWLLKYPSEFAFLESDEYERCGRFSQSDDAYVHRFSEEMVRILRERRSGLEESIPLAVFNVFDEKETKLCFYILRNHIRRNDPALLDDIRFLMSIPSVKALLHTEVTLNMPNELLRLALRVGNQAAAEILLTVPAIFRLDALDKEQSSEITPNATENQRARRMFAMFQELPFMSNPNAEMKDAPVNLGV